MRAGGKREKVSHFVRSVRKRGREFILTQRLVMKNLGGAAGTCCWRGAFNGLHYERRDSEGEESGGDVPAADR